MNPAGTCNPPAAVRGLKCCPIFKEGQQTKHLLIEGQKTPAISSSQNTTVGDDMWELLSLTHTYALGNRANKHPGELQVINNRITPRFYAAVISLLPYTDIGISINATLDSTKIGAINSCHRAIGLTSRQHRKPLQMH